MDNYYYKITNLLLKFGEKYEEKPNIDYKYLYNIIKYFHSIYKKTFTIYIICDNRSCKCCFDKKHKLIYYYKPIDNVIKKINNKYQNNKKLKNNEIKYYLHKKLPKELVQSITKFTKNRCIYKNKILNHLKKISHYNIFYNLLIRNSKFNKLFNFSKYCNYDNTCSICKILYKLLLDITDNINYNSNYISCYDTIYVTKNIKEYGFTYYSYTKKYSTCRYIKISDYSFANYDSDDNTIFILNDSDDDDYINNNESVVDPSYIDFWY